ncbi:MAG: glycoside hydrolase family 31 protein [Kiritimatiellae bacterium]|nr:glycoside hydrolase family 31 protein [Kiritimatiellia bacterium]
MFRLSKPLTLGIFLVVVSLRQVSAAPRIPPMAERAIGENGCLVYRERGLTLAIRPWGPDSLRVTLEPNSASGFKDWALDIEPRRTDAQISVTADAAIIRNGRIFARLTDNLSPFSGEILQLGRLAFYRVEPDGTETLFLAEKDNEYVGNNPNPRTCVPAEQKGLYRFTADFDAQEGERLYGLGEVPTDHLDLKGRVVDLYQRHVYAPVPFVVSSRRYGFLWNNPSLGRAEFTAERTRWHSDGSRRLDYWVTTGADYAHILSNYADATGHMPMPGKWVSGFWMCKLRYRSQDEFLAALREFKRRKIPLSMMVIDFFHWPRRGDWRLDPKFWPDPKAMVDEARADGVEVMISPWTLVNKDSENYGPMEEKGLFVSGLNGVSPFVGGGKAKEIDPTNPEAGAYMWNVWRRNYVSLGIRSFWLDPCDEFHSIDDYKNVQMHVGTGLEANGWFVIAHQKNVHLGQLSAGITGAVNICRNAWAGSQRWGACPAPHDINSSFSHFRRYLKAGLNVMMSGIPLWNCDIGGFHSPPRWNENAEFLELAVRFYQYGAFLPVMRTHGNRRPNEPWTYGGEYADAIISTIHLRERLRPYVEEQYAKAHATGLPPMRPVFFDFPDDTAAYDAEDEFLFGPDILVAPVTKYLAREREVYLPHGATWVDTASGRSYAGGCAVNVPAPLNRVPVFLRAEAVERLRPIFMPLYTKGN